MEYFQFSHISLFVYYSISLLLSYMLLLQFFGHVRFNIKPIPPCFSHIILLYSDCSQYYIIFLADFWYLYHTTPPFGK